MLTDWYHPGQRHLRGESLMCVLLGFVMATLCATFLKFYGTHQSWGSQIEKDWLIVTAVSGLVCTLVYAQLQENSHVYALHAVTLIGMYASSIVYTGLTLVVAFDDAPLHECSMKSTVPDDNLGVGLSALLLSSSLLASALLMLPLFGLWMLHILAKDSQALLRGHDASAIATNRISNKRATVSLTILLLAQIWIFAVGVSTLTGPLGHPDCYFLHDNDPTSGVTVAYVHSDCESDMTVDSAALHKSMKLCVARRLDISCQTCGNGYWGRMSSDLVDLRHTLVGRNFSARHALVMCTFFCSALVIFTHMYLGFRTTCIHADIVAIEQHGTDPVLRSAQLVSKKDLGHITHNDIATLAHLIGAIPHTKTVGGKETKTAELLHSALTLVSSVAAQQLQTETGFCVAYTVIVATRLVSMICVSALVSFFLRVDWSTPFQAECNELVEELDGLKHRVVQLLIAECVCWACVTALPIISKAHGWYNGGHRGKLTSANKQM